MYIYIYMCVCMYVYAIHHVYAYIVNRFYENSLI